MLEAAIALYAVWGLVIGIRAGDLGLAPYHLMLAFGFGAVCYYSVAHSLRTVT